MKSEKMKSFISYFLINFILLVLFTLFVNTVFMNESWWFLIQNEIIADLPLFLKKLPFIVYLFIFTFIYSLLFYLYLNVRERKKMKKIENAVRMLNDGQYSASVFLSMFSEETPIQISDLIDQELLKLQEKMIAISEEAISSAQQTSTLIKETKDEIIEQERKRIARELHDSVSQQLFAAAMLLSSIQVDEEAVTKSIKKQIPLIHSIIDEAQSEMRALLLHLRPIKLDGKSLKKGIEDLLIELSSKVPVKIIYDIEDIELTEVVENHLFRIIQELLSNVLRHAEAKELEVYLKQTDDFYRLRFVDDGKGFDMDKNTGSGRGLINIQERIEGLGGNFRVVSFPSQGTSVEIRIPLLTGRLL